MNDTHTQAAGFVVIVGFAVYATIAVTVLLARAAKPVVERVASVDLRALSGSFSGALYEIAQRPGTLWPEPHDA